MPNRPSPLVGGSWDGEPNALVLGELLVRERDASTARASVLLEQAVTDYIDFLNRQIPVGA